MGGVKRSACALDAQSRSVNSLVGVIVIPAKRVDHDSAFDAVVLMVTVRIRFEADTVICTIVSAGKSLDFRASVDKPLAQGVFIGMLTDRISAE